MLATQAANHSSPLGCWTFRECRPARLAAIVESIWEVQGTITHTCERVFPNSRVDLIVNLGPPQHLIDKDDRRRLQTACIAGFLRRSLLIESMFETHVFGVRLRPEGAARLFGPMLGGLCGEVAGVNDVGGPALSLTAKIADAPSFAERARIVCRWAEERNASASGLAPHVAWIASEIEASGGRVAIRDLRRAAAVSPRKLAADFREQLGTTPKLLARVVRFRRALAIVQSGNVSLTNAALAAGYCDQSHMNLEFRELAGMTPKDFVAATYPDGNSAVAF